MMYANQVFLCKGNIYVRTAGDRILQMFAHAKKIFLVDLSVCIYLVLMVSQNFVSTKTNITYARMAEGNGF